MVFNTKTKSGMITVEVAISLLSMVVFLFVMAGIFNENLDKMVTNSFKKTADENIGRTDYKSYCRDYTDSTIYVK